MRLKPAFTDDYATGNCDQCGMVYVPEWGDCPHCEDRLAAEAKGVQP